MANETLLMITGMGVPPYSARGLTQSITPIEEAKQIFRSVNGVAMDFSHDQFQLYRTNITCNDQQSPAIDGVWPGKIVTIYCVQEFCYLTAGGSPARPVITGSSRVEGSFTFYRPVLQMMVTAFNVDTNEYGAAVGWTLEAEELGNAG